MINVMFDAESFQLFGFGLQQLIIIVAAIVTLTAFIIMYTIYTKGDTYTSEAKIHKMTKNSFGKSTLSEIKEGDVSISVRFDSKNYRTKSWIKGIKK